MPDNIITLNHELIHTELKNLVRNSVEETLNSLLDAKRQGWQDTISGALILSETE